MIVLRDARQLITTADDIVIGRVQSLGTAEVDGRPVGQGDLRVDRVLWSRARTGEILSLRWPAATRGLGGTFMLTGAEQKSELFFLTRDPDGAVRADDQRMRPEDEQMVLDTLAAYPYRVTAPDRDLGDPVVVTVEFRNSTDKNITVPAVRSVDGTVTYGDGFRFKALIAVSDERGRLLDKSPPLAPVGEPFHRDPSLRPVVLHPGESSKVELSLSDLYGSVPACQCVLTVSVNGRGTRHFFRVRSPWESQLLRVVNTPAEAPFYVKMLRAGGEHTRTAALELQSRPDIATQVASDLMQLCDSLDTDSRRRVITVLSSSYIAPETRINFLLNRIDDPLVGNAALFGASRVIGPENPYRRDEVINRLMERLWDEDAQVRDAAASRLADVRATIAVPELQRLATEDASEGVRKSAQWAIDTIEGRNCCKCREKKVLP